MGIIYLLIILSGAIPLDCFDNFQKVEHDTSKINKLDRILKNISNKYEERKYLGPFAPYMINAYFTSTYHLLLLLANDINPNPGPTSSSRTQNNFSSPYMYRTRGRNSLTLNL